MKKSRMVLFMLLLVALFMYRDEIKSAFSESPVNINGEAAVLIDERTGQVIFSKNENKKVYPASTTKVLTALVVLDKSEPDEQVTIGEEVHFQTEGEARAGLFEGQVQSVEELLGAMLLQSGNDAARSLAVYISEKDHEKQLGTTEAIIYFADLMNQKAKEIGANRSHFVNPHGLHDAEHVSTAKDIAKIATEARKNKFIEHIVSQHTFATETHTYTNRNQLLNPNSEYFYENATGLKTGFTSQAGYCLVSSAEKDGNSLIAVILNSGKETMWSDSITLLDYGFNNKSNISNHK